MTRALERYWAGFARWLLRRTDRVGARHGEAARRLRALVLQIGEQIVAVHHGATDGALRLTLDQLSWQAELAHDRGLLNNAEIAHVRRVVSSVYGLIGPGEAGVATRAQR